MAKKRFTDEQLETVLRSKNGNVSHAAAELGVTPAAVRKRRDLMPGSFAKELQDLSLKQYREQRAGIYAETQRKIIVELVRRLENPEECSKLNVGYLNNFHGTLYDKERMERGQATEHVQHTMYKSLDPKQLEQIKEMARKMTQAKLEQVVYTEAEYTDNTRVHDEGE